MVRVPAASILKTVPPSLSEPPPALTGLDAAGHGLPPPPLWRRGMSDSTWKRTLRTLVRPTLRVRRDRRYRVETPRPAGEKPEDEHRLPLYSQVARSPARPPRR